MEFSQLTFSAALPEFVLIALALVMVLVAAFARQTQAEEQATIKLVRTLSLLGYFAAFLAVFSVPDGRIVLFNDLFAVNELVIYMKGLILVGAFCQLAGKRAMGRRHRQSRVSSIGINGGYRYVADGVCQ